MYPRAQNLDKAGVKALVTVLNGIDVTGCEVVVAPVAIHIPEVVSTIKKDIAVASQNCNFKVTPILAFFVKYYPSNSFGI